MTNTADEPLYWSLPRKIACRFFLVFFILYVTLNPNGVLPKVDMVYEYYIEPFHWLVVWIGAHILHLDEPITRFTGGSGDTTYDYVLLLFMVFTAAVSAALWSVIDRKARNYNKLFYWLTVIVRYYVAITMVVYGGVKIIKLQFPGPSPDRLIQPLGTMSPMGLAWTYMGYSTGFNYFTGLAELSCGLLLFFRRTATLGAVVGLVVAGNIMAINYCFDVPVKLLSTMLVIMCIFLLSKDAIRLINFFFLNKPAEAANLGPHKFKARWKNITLCVIKYVLIIYTLFGNAMSDVQAMKEYGDKAKKPPLYGLYNVQSFVRNKDTIAPLTTDASRWNKFTINYPGAARIKFMNDSLTRYNFEIDTVKHTIVMNTYADTINKARFTYQVKKDTLRLTGTFEQDSLHIVMEKYPLEKFILINRGFHWVNEFPFNR
ncbi:hypothetical protein [Mucilaginibacter pedocola]|uniref:DoxX family protein n=1 Tax=Mucilaginibacter pedocola TaxID=1792845 RepID=A0A1S9PGP2_9SPHI|nr:hypothetical protein [Mucilaginibacter pedocola]OOQ60135.1 hypothetical protein BC343_26815 [Mucilaginibacter pedocola]